MRRTIEAVACAALLAALAPATNATAGKSGTATFADIAPAAAYDAARAGLLSFVRPLGRQKTDFGFSPADDLSKVTIGEPFRFYTFRWKALANRTSSTRLSELLWSSESSDDWLFPVVASGHGKVLLTVRCDSSGQWKAAELGWAPLAREIDSIYASWPPEKGYHLVLMAVGLVPCHWYFAIPEVDDRNITPIYFPGRAPEQAVTTSQEREGAPSDSAVTSTGARYEKLGRFEDFLPQISAQISAEIGTVIEPSHR
jgi:hypothetical protein